MPIIRTYACPECNHMMDVVLDSADWDAPPPECPACEQRETMRQEFKPVAIGGSLRSRAVAIAEDIASNDYKVADLSSRGEGEPTKHRLKDQQGPPTAAAWAAHTAVLEQAISIGRQTRIESGGNGLDVLQGALKSGAQKDLIAESKKRSIKVW